MQKMSRTGIVGIMALAMSLLLVTGCKRAGDTGNQANVPSQLAGDVKPGAQQAMDSAPNPSGAVTPQLITKVSMTLRVKGIQAAFRDIGQVTRDYGGVIVGQTLSYENTGDPHGSIEILTPQARLSDFLARIEHLGVPINEQRGSEDVSRQLVDSASTLRNLRAEEASLIKIMAQAHKIPDVLEVEKELARVRGEIERTDGELQAMKQQVAYSTVSLSLSEESVRQPMEGQPGFFASIAGTAGRSVTLLYRTLLLIVNLLIGIGIYLLPLALLGWILYRIALRIAPLRKLGAALLRAFVGKPGRTAGYPEKPANNLADPPGGIFP